MNEKDEGQEEEEEARYYAHDVEDDIISLNLKCILS